MKREDLFTLIGEADEQKAAEAAAPRKAKKSPWLRWGMLAACLCLVVLGGFWLRHPGMGCTSPVNRIAALGEEVYYSTWKNGVFRWAPGMKRPERVIKTGQLAETEAGLFLWSQKENEIWEVRDGALLPRGCAGELPEDAELIGLEDGFALWRGTRENPESDRWTRVLLRTDLVTGKPEELLTLPEGGILGAALHDGILFCHCWRGEDPMTELLVAIAPGSGEMTLRREFPVGESALGNRLRFLPDRIIVMNLDEETLWQLDYAGGEPRFLSDHLPESTLALDFYDGKLWFETSFGENESEEFLSGGGYYSKELVSLDPETGAVARQKEFSLDNGDGTERYTLMELAMTEEGFYFKDPHGLYYHRWEDGTDTEITG